MKSRVLVQTRPLTLAEVCEAIAGGKIPAQMENGYYTVSHRALRQLQQGDTPQVMLRATPPASIAS